MSRTEFKKQRANEIGRAQNLSTNKAFYSTRIKSRLGAVTVLGRNEKKSCRNPNPVGQFLCLKIIEAARNQSKFRKWTGETVRPSPSSATNGAGP